MSIFWKYCLSIIIAVDDYISSCGVCIVVQNIGNSILNKKLANQTRENALDNYNE